jgi:hypothetical protein
MVVNNGYLSLHLIRLTGGRNSSSNPDMSLTCRTTKHSMSMVDKIKKDKMSSCGPSILVRTNSGVSSTATLLQLTEPTV